MSYFNLTDFYLIDNKYFNKSIIEPSDYILRYKNIGKDMEFFSNRDWLVDRFADILKRSHMQHELLQFLDYYPTGYGKFFIVEPQKIDDFAHQLEMLINWMLQDNYCLDNHSKDKAYEMLDTVQFETFDCMFESWLYPIYGLIALKKMTLIASKDGKFIVLRAFEGR